VPNNSDLQRRFGFHPADTEGRIANHSLVRRHLLLIAQRFDEVLPEGEEKKTAINKLEEAMMWANAAIARYGR